MIHYFNYHGTQTSCAIVDGVIRPMDDDAAVAVSYSAHVLAAGLPAVAEEPTSATANV